MKKSFILKEHHLFDAIKFLVEKKGNIKKEKILIVFIQFFIFSYFTVYSYFSLQNIYITVGVAIFFIVFIFLYLKFLDFSLDKKIRKIIEKTRKEEIGKENFIELLEGFILFYDLEKNTEFKFKLEKLEITENKDYIFFYSKIGIITFIPKEELKEEELTELKEIFKK